MLCEHEAVPGVTVGALGTSERLFLWGFRMNVAGRDGCPRIAMAFDDHLGSESDTALKGLYVFGDALVRESSRPLVFAWLCTRGVSWDEAAVLALLEAAQRSHVRDIMDWLVRLGVSRPSTSLRCGLTWLAGSFASAGRTFDTKVATLTNAAPSNCTI